MIQTDPGLIDPIEAPTRPAGFRYGLSVIRDRTTEIYMVRWVVARLFGWELKFNLFLSSDPRCMHDHPWPFLSVMLAGSYVEHSNAGVRRYAAPCMLYRPAKWRHRIEIKEPCLTLNISAPRRRNWGFWTVNGWIPWAKYKDGVHKC